MKISKKKGFTLVEMIVTLIIIITLSLLSFPLYEGRNHKTSMLAEGYVLLGIIVDAQVSYYNEYGNFLAPPISVYGHEDGRVSWTCKDDVLGINAINNRYFTYFNAYGYANRYDPYKYMFMAEVRSRSAGTISLQYNRTHRYEPVVSGV